MIRMKNPSLRFDILSLFPKTIEGFTEEAAYSGKRSIGDFWKSTLLTCADGPRESTERLMTVPSVEAQEWCSNLNPCSMLLRKLQMNLPQLSTWHRMENALTTPLAKELSASQHLLLISGHYEGIDQRVREHRGRP